MSLSIIGIIVALICLMILVYKKVNIILASIICCLITAFFSGLPLLTSLKESYMPGFAEFIINNFLIFAFSALFGKLMEVSGAAASFAKMMYSVLGTKYSVFGCMIATSLLVYGGVSNFVIVFTMFPIFRSVFKKADLPHTLIPGVIYAASATYAASMLPGTPSLNNLIPMQYLDTPATAAPVVGLICSIVTMVLIFLYFQYEFNKARKLGQHFESAAISNENESIEETKGSVSEGLIATIPMITLVVSLNLFSLDILVSMTISILIAIVIYHKNLSGKIGSSIHDGFGSAGTAVLNTSAVVGFGAVVKASTGFQTIINALLGIGGTPLLSLGIATTLIAGATGSGTGGLGIAMQVLADHYLSMGLNPEIIHRVASIASIGLDSLPHNGLVVTVILACGCNHKQSYKPTFVTSVVITLIALAVAIVTGSILYPL